MIIDCGTVDEFLEELGHQADAGTVFQKTVRVRIDRQAQQAEEVSHVVVLIATVFLGLGADRPCLMELLLSTGIDDMCSRNQRQATEKAEFLKAQIAKFCADRGLLLRGGKWEVV